MKLNLSVTRILVVFLLCLTVAACGGGSSKAGSPSMVDDIFTDDPSVLVGDDVNLDVLFSFSTDTVVHDNHNVSLIVRIPNGLMFETDTARIDEIGGTDRVTPSVESCANGDTILTFDLGQNVLANATDPSGPGDGKLTMALAGTEAVGAVTIEALSGYDFEKVSGSCAAGIVPQDSTALTVL